MNPGETTRAGKSLNWLLEKRTLVALYVVLAIVATLQSILLEPKLYEKSGYAFPHYNNYLIFKNAFFHLLHHQDLYQLYPAQHWDLYKYTPTFSLLFGPMALLPDWLGLPAWHLLNMLVLLAALYFLPGFSTRQKGWMTLLIAIEAMTSIQNEQSNALIAGLIVFAFGLAERKSFFLAAGCLVLSAFIKPFGVVGFALFLFYPDKLKHALYALGWACILFVLPLVILPWSELLSQYGGWLRVLASDQEANYGLSVLGWLHTWFHAEPDKNIVTLTGALLFLFPLLRFKSYGDATFRMLTLSSILIWVVIFNHMAESPTFVIAMTGASIWYFAKARHTYDTILFILVFVFISLSSTDIIPHAWRKSLFKPYVLKVVPCIFLWLRIVTEMMLTAWRPAVSRVSQPS